MYSAIIYFNILIFAFLSGLHIYWAFGGKWALDSALPTAPQNNAFFKVGAIGTLVVAIGLMIFAIVILSNNFLLDFRSVKYLTYTIAIIFCIRSIGDFRYVGLFKKVKETTFARYDTRIYIPLCIYLAVSTFIIASH